MVETVAEMRIKVVFSLVKCSWLIENRKLKTICITEILSISWVFYTYLFFFIFWLVKSMKIIRFLLQIYNEIFKVTFEENFLVISARYAFKNTTKLTFSSNEKRLIMSKLTYFNLGPIYKAVFLFEIIIQNVRCNMYKLKINS